jgi:uncharacterized protein with GYD domain
MATYIMLTRLSHEALRSPSTLVKLEREVKKRVAEECPELHWKANYAVLGPCDYLDIFEAPDNETATKAATVIRTFGHAQTETWCATEWSRFKELLG